MIKKRELTTKIDDLKRQQSKINIETLEKDLCEITFDCSQIKKKNMATIKYLQNEKSKISSEKPEATHNTIYAIKAVSKVTS